MSTALLHRANTQLQIHRIWFRTFLTSTRQTTRTAGCSTPRISYPPTACNHCRLHISHHHVSFTEESSNAISMRARRYEKRSGVRTKGFDVEQLKEFIRDVKIEEVSRLYGMLSKKRALDLVPAPLLTQHVLRAAKAQKSKPYASRDLALVNDLFALIQRVARDIQGGKIRLDAGDRNTKMNILDFFAEVGRSEDGVEFWNWLRSQAYGGLENPGVVAKAMTVLIRAGSSLPELAELYETTLNQTPIPFAPYHLSHNAIIPDRARSFDAHMPLALLQGMIAARVIHGDFRNAYLDLDTACRLQPNATRRGCFPPFLEERPLVETFTVFAMACRGGGKMTDPDYRNLLLQLRQHMQFRSPRKTMAFLRGMVSATYSFLRFRNIVRPSTASETVIAISEIMQIHGVAELSPSIKKALVEKVDGLAHAALDAFAAHRVKATAAAYNSMISRIGSRSASRETTLRTMVRMQNDNLKPTIVTYHSLLQAAGTTADKDLVTKSWKSLVGMRLDANQTPQAIDLHVLIAAAQKTDHTAYASQQVEGLAEHFSSDQLEYMRNTLASAKPPADNTPAALTPLDMNWLFAEIDKVKADVQILHEAADQVAPTAEPNRVPVPMTFLRPRRPALPEVEMRKLYDEYTLEPKQPQSADFTPITGTTSPAEAARTDTGIPFDVIRYENWKTINYLLEQSDIEVPAYGKEVDKALAKRLPPPDRKGLLHLRPGEVIESYGLSDVVKAKSTISHATVEHDYTDEEIRKGRTKIRNLRGAPMHENVGSK